MRKTIVKDSDDSYDAIILSDYNDGDIMLIQNGEAIIIQDEYINLVITALSEALQRKDIK